MVNIIIVGGGVMGRLWTGWLTAAGHRVTVIDAAPDVVYKLNERGVWIRERDAHLAHRGAGCYRRRRFGAGGDRILFRQDRAHR